MAAQRYVYIVRSETNPKRSYSVRTSNFRLRLADHNNGRSAIPRGPYFLHMRGAVAGGDRAGHGPSRSGHACGGARGRSDRSEGQLYRAWGVYPRQDVVQLMPGDQKLMPRDQICSSDSQCHEFAVDSHSET